MTVKHLPEVGSIEGVALIPSPSPDASSHRVTLQYSAHGQTDWYELAMPLPDALYLLNLLEQMSNMHGLEHLRRPPGRTQ